MDEATDKAETTLGEQFAALYKVLNVMELLEEREYVDKEDVRALLARHRIGDYGGKPVFPPEIKAVMDDLDNIPVLGRENLPKDTKRKDSFVFIPPTCGACRHYRPLKNYFEEHQGRGFGKCALGFRKDLGPLRYGCPSCSYMLQKDPEKAADMTGCKCFICRHQKRCRIFGPQCHSDYEHFEPKED